MSWNAWALLDNGASEPSLDWFHKYRVTAVVQADPTGYGETVENTYSYADPAWHYNNDPFTPADERTWSQWRGYRKVTATTGSVSSSKTRTVSLYLQGMDGDKTSDGTRSATVTGLDLTGLDVADQTDSDPYQGFLREQITYNGDTPVSVTVNDPWKSKTATQNKSYADIDAYFVRTAETHTHTYLTESTAWRTHTVTTSYDGYGMVAKVNDGGDAAVSDDQTCTRTWYARNTAAGITSLVSRTRTVGRTCSAAESDLSLPTSTSTRGDVLSDTAMVYDNTSATTWTASQTPTEGQATWAGRASAYPSAVTDGERNPTSWRTIGKVTFDDLGRVLTAADTNGNTTTTVYTPTAAGPLTRSKVTNALSQSTYTYYDPAHGETTRILDANSKVTQLTYDALGRLTGVWKPNRSKSSGYSANTTYAYSVSNDAPSWTSTSTLKADGSTYSTSYTLYDSLMRELQIQSPSPVGGRLLTDTRYDSRGLAYETYADIFDSTTEPNSTYTRAEYGEAPKQTAIVYDAVGRPTTSTLYVYGVKKWSTTSSYTGDSIASTALEGGSATRTFTDALGRTSETREYPGTSATGSTYTSTSYTYTKDGKPKTITGPDGEQWSYGYDLYGRETSATDPDTGTRDTTYTALDQVETTKSANGAKVITAYDTLGRTTGTWKTSQTDTNKLTAYTYDTVLKGQPATSTRYVGGVSGDVYTTTVTAYDSLYRATGTTLTLPDDNPLVAAGAVASPVITGVGYDINGTVEYVKEPAAAGLASETVSYDYNEPGLLTSSTGTSDYLVATDYSALGQVQQLTLGRSSATSAKKTYVTNTYEEGTGRLTRSNVTTDTHAYMLQQLAYTYDQAGNVTSTFDATTWSGAIEADYQCYAYNGYQRLTEAWTPKTADCATSSQTSSNLDGAAPYWTEYAYDQAGQRTTATENSATGSSSTTRYCYAEDSSAHALTATTTATSCTGATAQYVYDDSGNTKTWVDADADTQSLTWDSESRLATLTEGGETTAYTYGADGSLLMRANPDGGTVLYLGATEVHLTADGDTWAQRSYTAGGTSIAVRSNESGTEELSFLAGDQHNTSTLALTGDSQTAVKRWFTPFGETRGQTATWIDDKAFLGKSADTDTGLTHLGAREYDPHTGRFISVDPLLTLDQHQSLNGYTYANNNPATASDPTGLESCGLSSYCSGSNGTYGTYESKDDPTSDDYDGSSHDETPDGGDGNLVNTCIGTCLIVSDPATGLPVLNPTLANDPEVKIYADQLAQTPALNPVAQELLIAGCGWVPIAGVGCDVYDIVRSWSEGEVSP